MKSIEEQLKEVQILIHENKKLQLKYPEHKKSLKIGLESLYELEKEMKEALIRRMDNE